MSYPDVGVKSREEIAREVCPSFPLDLGIARAVEILQTVETIVTFESCEGGEGHSYDRPTVRFHGSFGSGWAALAVCMDWHLGAVALNRVWSIDDGEPSGPYWELIFSKRIDW